eukprot:TRINITY_DN265_c0_g1_i1.p1 TRINITY_DN265_c0_g1~~TRINITY_DN265_c0_g1_i1.p1  ORF type:complete len:487 (+),score=68.23 TRINITY_DN265_c0_g1_i1:262-1722(+)
MSHDCVARWSYMGRLRAKTILSASFAKPCNEELAFWKGKLLEGKTLEGTNSLMKNGKDKILNNAEAENEVMLDHYLAKFDQLLDHYEDEEDWSTSAGSETECNDLGYDTDELTPLYVIESKLESKSEVDNIVHKVSYYESAQWNAVDLPLVVGTKVQLTGLKTKSIGLAVTKSIWNGLTGTLVQQYADAEMLQKPVVRGSPAEVQDRNTAATEIRRQKMSDESKQNVTGKTKEDEPKLETVSYYGPKSHTLYFEKIEKKGGSEAASLLQDEVCAVTVKITNKRSFGATSLPQDEVCAVTGNRGTSQSNRSYSSGTSCRDSGKCSCSHSENGMYLNATERSNETDQVINKRNLDRTTHHGLQSFESVRDRVKLLNEKTGYGWHSTVDSLIIDDICAVTGDRGDQIANKPEALNACEDPEDSCGHSVTIDDQIADAVNYGKTCWDLECSCDHSVAINDQVESATEYCKKTSVVADFSRSEKTIEKRVL